MGASFPENFHLWTIIRSGRLFSSVEYLSIDYDDYVWRVYIFIIQNFFQRDLSKIYTRPEILSRQSLLLDEPG